jgi:molybdopterin molybdotransferase
MIPQAADAVVMIEHTQPARENEVEVLRAVGHGENILQVGEDVSAGEVVLDAGRLLGAAEIGGLMALGHDHVDVARKPSVAILSSGDEVIPPGRSLGEGQVYDVNSYTLRTLVQAAGGEARTYDIIPDKIDAFRETAHIALSDNDLVIFTAGSSVSVRDLTARTIDELGKPGVLVHGVNVRPGKPTILAVCNGKGVIGLPGNPVSALVIANLFVRPAIEKLLGLEATRPAAQVQAKLTVNLVSAAGREDWIGVSLKSVDDYFLADPIFGKSNLIFTLARADGLIRIEPHATGLKAGEWVSVYLRS